MYNSYKGIYHYCHTCGKKNVMPRNFKSCSWCYKSYKDGKTYNKCVCCGKSKPESTGGLCLFCWEKIRILESIN